MDFEVNFEVDSKARIEKVVADLKVSVSWILEPVIVVLSVYSVCLASLSASIIICKKPVYTCLKLLLAAGQLLHVVLLL